MNEQEALMRQQTRAIDRQARATARLARATEQASVAGVRVDDPPTDAARWWRRAELAEACEQAVVQKCNEMEERWHKAEDALAAARSSVCVDEGLRREKLSRAQGLAEAIAGSEKYDVNLQGLREIATEITGLLAAVSFPPEPETALRQAVLAHFLDGDEGHPDWPVYVVRNLRKALAEEVKDTGDWYQATISLLDRLAAAGSPVPEGERLARSDGSEGAPVSEEPDE